MARCSGREHPSGLTFAPSTNGRTRCVPNRYCGSRTSISPNFVCQRSFFRLGDASAGVDESPAPSPRPAARPNCATPPVPEDASPRPSALPPRRLPSMPPRRLRPPAQSTTPAGEAPDAPATPPSAPHRSTPRPPSVTSRQINQTEPTLHRFESHPQREAFPRLDADALHAVQDRIVVGVRRVLLHLLREHHEEGGLIHFLDLIGRHAHVEPRIDSVRRRRVGLAVGPQRNRLETVLEPCTASKSALPLVLRGPRSSPERWGCDRPQLPPAGFPASSDRRSRRSVRHCRSCACRARRTRRSICRASAGGNNALASPEP